MRSRTSAKILGLSAYGAFASIVRAWLFDSDVDIFTLKISFLEIIYSAPDPTVFEELFEVHAFVHQCGFVSFTDSYVKYLFRLFILWRISNVMFDALFWFS